MIFINNIIGIFNLYETKKIIYNEKIIDGIFISFKLLSPGTTG